MILVTGATGFLGGHVIRQLIDAGHQVVALSRYGFRPETRFLLADDIERVPLCVVPAGDESAVRGVFETYRPDSVVHLDALVDVVELSTQPLKAIETNFLPTVALLELAREFGVETFVYASSIAVLPTIQYEPITARHPVLLEVEGPGGGFYGASKVASEVFALEYAASFGLNVRIVRPSAIYGFGMQWPIGLKPLVEGGVDGRKIDLGEGVMPARDFTHVADVAGIIERLVITRDAEDRLFFAATGNALISESALIDTVRGLLPELEVRFAPRGDDVPESKYRGVIDMSPVRDQLDYSLRFPRLKDGLAEYIDQYRRYRAASAAAQCGRHG